MDTSQQKWAEDSWGDGSGGENILVGNTYMETLKLNCPDEVTKR